MRAWLMAAVIWAGLVGAQAGSAAPPPDGQPHGPGVAVPVGRLGDLVHYNTFRLAEDGTWSPTGASAFVVEAVERSIDQLGVWRDVATIHRSDGVVRLNGDPYLGTWAMDTTRAAILRMDLDRRDVVQASGLRVHDDPLGSWWITDTLYGPDFGHALPEELARVSVVPALLDFQGESIGPGAREPLRDHLFAGQFLVHEEGVQVGPVSTRIIDGAYVDGQPALIVERKGCLDVDVRDPSEPVRTQLAGAQDSGGRLLSFLHAQVPLGSKACFTAQFWLTHASPYPVLYLEQVTAGDTAPQTWLEVLQAYVPGGDPIPWGPRTPSPPRPLERTLGQLHPADGIGGRVPYPLSGALEAVRDDSMLSGFAAWQTEHPDHQLVGARFMPGELRNLVYLAEFTGPPWHWVLVFGSPPASYFLVQTGLNAEGRAVNLEIGRATGEPFAWHDIPESPLTLAEMDRFWRTVGASEAPPRYVSWGARCERGDCLDVEKQPRIVVRYEGQGFSLFDLWTYGNQDPGPAKAPDAAWSDNVWTSTACGCLMSWYRDHSAVATPEGIFPALQAARPPSFGHALAAADNSVPSIRLIVTAASSLLALAALLAFAWRALASGAGVVATGYTRLKRAQVTHHPLRARVVERIAGEPGISPPQLQSALGVPWSTLVYHLSILRRHDLVASVRDGRHLRYFERGIARSSRDQLAILRNPRTRSLYEIILRDPGQTCYGLARRLRITPPAVAKHLRRLLRSGLIVRHPKGRSWRYTNASMREAAASGPDAVEAGV